MDHSIYLLLRILFSVTVLSYHCVDQYTFIHCCVSLLICLSVFFYVAIFNYKYIYLHLFLHFSLTFLLWTLLSFANLLFKING